MNRRAMELAVNTLVVLILGITIVTGGMVLMYKIFDKVQGIPSEVDAQTQKQLFNILLGSKKRISVLNNVQDIKRKEQAIFPVATMNQEEGTSTEFKVDPVPKLVVDPGDDCAQQWTANPDQNYLDACPVASALDDPFMLKRYESKAFYVVVDVPKGASNGEYTFEVNVQKNDNGWTDYARAKVNVDVR